MSFRQSITGVILAGGRGSRMGGQDKGLVPLLSKPLYQYILARLSPQVGQVIINANRNQARYRESQLTVISDLNSDFSGPLAGMQAALHYAKTEWLLFVPCDVPDFPLNLAKVRKALTLPAMHKIMSENIQHSLYYTARLKLALMITLQEAIAN